VVRDPQQQLPRGARVGAHIGCTVTAAVWLQAASSMASHRATDAGGSTKPRHQRLLWANDARHYHGFVHEPPISVDAAQTPVTEVAGLGVTTFVFMVARGDGLFYPSRVGHRWPNGTVEGTQPPYDLAAYYRLASNLDSLAERGLDPLELLIDAAHKNSMEFIASLRVPAYLGLDSGTVKPQPEDGPMADPLVRDVQLAVLTELALDYDTDGIELDLSCGPGGSSPVLRAQDAAEFGPVITDWVRSVAAVVHGRPTRGLVGVRVYPTPAMNGQ